MYVLLQSRVKDDSNFRLVNSVMPDQQTLGNVFVVFSTLNNFAKTFLKTSTDQRARTEMKYDMFVSFI